MYHKTKMAAVIYVADESDPRTAQLIANFKKASESLREMLVFGKMNAVEHKKLCAQVPPSPAALNQYRWA